MSYPEPSELQEFAQEPVPFHEFHVNELELLDNGKIRVGIENVEYIYHPTYLRMDIGEVSEYPEWEENIEEIWNDGVAWEIQEDFISVEWFKQIQHTAYWVLEEITIGNPNLYQ